MVVDSGAVVHTYVAPETLFIAHRASFRSMHSNAADVVCYAGVLPRAAGARCCSRAVVRLVMSNGGNSRKSAMQWNENGAGTFFRAAADAARFPRALVGSFSLSRVRCARPSSQQTRRFWISAGTARSDSACLWCSYKTMGVL